MGTHVSTDVCECCGYVTYFVEDTSVAPYFQEYCMNPECGFYVQDNKSGKFPSDEVLELHECFNFESEEYSEIIDMSESLIHKEKLNVLEYLIDSLTYEERSGFKSKYLDEGA